MEKRAQSDISAPFCVLGWALIMLPNSVPRLPALAVRKAAADLALMVSNKGILWPQALRNMQHRCQAGSELLFQKRPQMRHQQLQHGDAH